ncbi:calcium-binding protein [Bradyrhizobium sp. sBnM-33]|uniref:calcium-binding protein n=1 Tax=Bradyrhizobium sp. sBnM-33 TaxID=2831780 RepID=UPI001BCE052E|nr:hypothetical protein [Bradyrhizobium sp. sBnM-33]WOH48417.1 hypothetical protein RX328_30455 [Bradyrhizobium sp. sBnM-33]
MVDIPASTATSARLEISQYGLSPGGSFSGLFETAGDHDWIAVTLTAGTLYRFYGSGIGSTGTTDTTMSIRNSAGVILTTNDDAGAGLNPYIELTAGATGTYYIDMALFSAAVPTGEYSVWVSSASVTNVFMTEGVDVVTAPGAGERVVGGAGNDTISLGASTGSVGFDALGEQGNDTLNGNDQNNFVSGGIGNDVIFGFGGSDTLWGDAGTDQINGGAGNDEIFGGLGTDTMTGETGNDFYYVDNVGDIIIEAAGGGTLDTVFTALNNYVLPSQVENLKLQGGTATLTGTGNSLNNEITGNLGANTLLGAGGNDTLLGGLGADLLNGGAGKDTMTGGGGLDRMVISSLADSGVAFANRDVINTFAHGDKIDLAAIDANSLVGGDQAFTFVSDFTGAAGQLQWDLTGVSPTGVKGYLLQGDVNGDCAADFSFQIYTSPTAALPGGSGDGIWRRGTLSSEALP